MNLEAINPYKLIKELQQENEKLKEENEKLKEELSDGDNME